MNPPAGDLPEFDGVHQEIMEFKEDAQQPPGDIWHEVTFTVGLEGLRDPKGELYKVKAFDLWQGRPEVLLADQRLLQVKVEIPESLFAVAAKVRGRLESRLVEEYQALIEELE